MPELQDKLEAARAEALQRLQESETENDVEAVRIDFVSRNGRIPQLMKELRNVPDSEKPQVGKLANEVKNDIQQALESALERLASVSDRKGEAVDVTLPGRTRSFGHRHPISRVLDDAVDIFRRMGFIAADGPDLETEYHNFDALNTPADHPSRDIQDTFYLPDGRLLRTQTSPVQIRVMESQEPPVRIVCPGRCFRRDTPDATHSMNFHQIEGLYVDKDVSLADLKGTLRTFAHELLGADVDVRFRPHFFPFTEPSIEYDFSCIICGGKGCRVCGNSGWLEISGAGMVDPAVFQAVGYDAEKWSGFAFGMGVERIAMIRYAINDIRLLYENDMRFLRQF
ncbi:MAG: phenylalanine--tRNA ligase subunit alpha [Verrucomicrobiota bacterium]